MPLEASTPRFKAVVFDMDGLVLDSEQSYVFAWRRVAENLGARLEDEFVEDLFGRQADDVIRLLAEKLGKVFDAERFCRDAENYWRAHVHSHGIPAMPGVSELLALLKRHRVPFALATNSMGIFARECLRAGGLEGAFPVMVTRDQVAAGKPEPDLILEAAKRMEVSAEQCLVLEDSATGLQAAARAGAMPILVSQRPAPLNLQSLAAAYYRSLLEASQGIRPFLGLRPT